MQVKPLTQVHKTLPNLAHPYLVPTPTQLRSLFLLVSPCAASCSCQNALLLPWAWLTPLISQLKWHLLRQAFLGCFCCPGIFLQLCLILICSEIQICSCTYFLSVFPSLRAVLVTAVSAGSRQCLAHGLSVFFLFLINEPIPY